MVLAMIYCHFVAAHLNMKQLKSGFLALSVVGVITISLLTVLGFFGLNSYLLDLTTHFHFQYAIGSALLAGIFLLYRKPLLTVFATFGLIVQLTFLLPYYFQPDVQATQLSQVTETQLLFSNLNYGTTDFAPLIKEVQSYQPELVGIVELPQDHYDALVNDLPEYPFHYHIPGRARLGLALFSKIEFVNDPTVQYWADDRFPSIIAQIKDQESNQILTIVIVHPPPPITSDYETARNAIFTGIANFAKTQTDPVVVAGDFNSTSWSPAFQDLLSDQALVDSRNNQGLQPSWPSQLPKIFRIPIDHVLVSHQVNVLHRQLLPSVGSDHLPVLVDFSW